MQMDTDENSPDFVTLLWNDRVCVINPRANLLACRMADPTPYGPELVAAFAAVPLDAGWVVDCCVFCGQDVHMGPRQLSMYELCPQDFTVCCLACGPAFTKAVRPGEEPKVENMGGG